MSENEIFSKIVNILKEILGDEIEITYDTIAKDIDGWDSLTHFDILFKIEEEFNFKFTFLEIRSLANVGKMVEVVLSHVSN